MPEPLDPNLESDVRDEVPEEPETPKESLAQKQRRHLGDVLSRVSRGSKTFGKPAAPGAAKGPAAPGAGAEGSAGRTAARAGGQAAKAAGRAAAQAGRMMAQLAARAATALASSPVGWIIIGIILLVIIILGIVFAIWGLSGQSGGGLAITPTTASQVQQATLLSALSGDRLAKNEIVLETVTDEKERYQRIQRNADQYSAAHSAVIKQKAAEFTVRLDEMTKEQDLKKKAALVRAIEQDMLAFERTLPFGVWITALAKSHEGEPTGNFCRITKVSERLACASFTSTTLWEAGVPNTIVPTTTELWKNRALRLVIDRAELASDSRINESLMRPGDIVWFGSGERARTRYSGALFDHVGIYIGQGQIIDSSSTQTRIVQRPLTSHRFNGAKRYGTD